MSRVNNNVFKKPRTIQLSPYNNQNTGGSTMIKKISLAIFTILLFCSVFSYAATNEFYVSISGEVVDKYTNQALDNEATVELEKFDSQGHLNKWTMTTIPKGQIRYDFGFIGPGKYLIKISCTNYFYRYYGICSTNNFNYCQDLSSRTIIVVNKDKDINLDTVYLEPFPITISDTSLSPTSVPPQGGIIQIKAKIRNNANDKKTLLVWNKITTSFLVQSEEGYYSGFDESFLGSGVYVTVRAYSEKDIILNFYVPDNAPNAHQFKLELVAGTSIWSPVCSATYVGDFYRKR